MATITENPSFAEAPDAQPQQRARADLEAAVASLHASFNVNDGNEAESVETLERLLRAHGDELRAEFAATLETKLEAAAPLSAAVRSAVAHLTEAPLNFHQATVMYAAEQSGSDGEAARGALLLRLAGSLVLSTLMVLMQCMVAVGVFAGTVEPSCATSDQCAQKGTYCTVGGIDRCTYCGEDTPLPQQTDPATGGTLNRANAPDYAGFNLTLVAEVCAAPIDNDRSPVMSTNTVRWCEACVLNDGRVDELTVASHAQANVAAMGPFDWVALVFATVVVALTINGELKV
jgi:hypothetical protein